MNVPEPGEEPVKVEVALTHSQCKELIAWVGAIRRVTRSRNTDQAISQFDRDSQRERRQFVNSAMLLAKFVEEEFEIEV